MTITKCDRCSADCDSSGGNVSTKGPLHFGPDQHSAMTDIVARIREYAKRKSKAAPAGKDNWYTEVSENAYSDIVRFIDAALAEQGVCANYAQTDLETNEGKRAMSETVDSGHYVKSAEPDWEQRRWDAAVAFMAAAISHGNVTPYTEGAAIEHSAALVEKFREAEKGKSE